MRAVLLSLVAASAQADVKIPDMAQLHTQCSALLQDVASSGHSDVEVAAFCRAAYPPNLCRTMKTSLGSMPWSSERMDATCQAWEDQVQSELLATTPERRAMSYEELQQTLETSAAAKRQVGINMPRNPDGSVNLEKTASLKYEQTQALSAAWNTYYPQAASYVNSMVYGEDASAKTQVKAEEGHVFETRFRAGSVVSLTVVGFLSAFSGAMLLAKRVARRQRGVVLLEDGDELEAEVEQ